MGTGGGSAHTGGGAGQTGGGSTQTGGGSATGGGDGATGGGVGVTGGGSTTTGGGDGATGGGVGMTGGGSTTTGGGDGTTGGGSAQTGGGTGFPDSGIDFPDASVADAGVVLTCPQGWIQCGDSCIDPSNDHDNCGFCGNVCDPTANALSATCTNSVCVVAACTFPAVDVDHAYANGCEGQQDFAISFNESALQLNPDGGAPTLFLNAGGTSTLDVNMVRSNWGGSTINANFSQANSGTAIYANDALNITDTATFNIQTQSTTTAGSYATTVRVYSGSIEHTLPLNVQVIQPTMTISGITVLQSNVAFSGSQVPTGAGLITVRVAGTGLLSVASVWQGQTVLGQVSGGTDTLRDWTLNIPHGGCFNDVSGCPVALLFKNSSGGDINTVSAAFTLTPVVTNSLTGNDVSGRGTWSSPYQSLDRAFAVSGAGDVVLFLESTPPAATSAPSGLDSIVAYGSAKSIECNPTTPSIGLQAATGLRVVGVTFSGCDAGVVLEDNSAAPLLIVNSKFPNIPHPLEISIPGDVTIRNSTFSSLAAPATMFFTSGSLELQQSTFNEVAINAINTAVHVNGGTFTGSQNAITIGLSSTPANIENATVFTSADGVVLTPGAFATLTAVDLLGANRAVVVNGASATLASCNIHQNETGVYVTGASPQITTSGTTAFWANRVNGLTIAPTSGTVVANITAPFAGNRTGLLIQNAAGATTNLTLNANFFENTDYGLRVEGGTTNLATGSRIDGIQKKIDAGIVWLASGAGNLHFTNGVLKAPKGQAIRADSASHHEFDVGINGNVTIDMTGHVFDNTFGLQDLRAVPGVTQTSQIHASFIGADGHPYSWQGSYSFTGSYNTQITPREWNCWATANTFVFIP